MVNLYDVTGTSWSTVLYMTVDGLADLTLKVAVVNEARY